MAFPLKLKDRYEIRQVLGQGGMGVVYRAYDSVVKREVALKTLRDAPNRIALQLFYKECDVLASMSHPNIVEIFDIGEFEEDGASKPYFVMPLLAGVSLDKLIKTASHRLTVERAIEIISQACRGLQAAHERGLVHRDLKPSNLYILEDNAVKIIDFGLAHMVDAKSSTGQKGTFLYMAPEQVEMQALSPQTDIFALGVTAYETLTRRLPFERGSLAETAQAILHQTPPPVSELNPAVNQLIGRVIHKALAKQPWHRFSTAREFGETLQKALRNDPIEFFDPARIQPRVERASKTFEEGDYQYAGEILTELEAEGHTDPTMSRLRRQIDQAARRKTVGQLLDSARTRLEQEEYPLALQKVQEVLQLDPDNADALSLKSVVESRRGRRQIDDWIRLARQHVENYAFTHARQALQNVLQQSSKDNLALELLAEVDRKEQAYARELQEKEKLYQDAVDAYHKGEFSTALGMLQRVLDLDRRAPNLSSRESGAAYQNLFNEVRSERDAIDNAYAEAKRRLGEREFARALAICDEYLAKHPGHALFQALKFDIQERERQELSFYIAEIDRRVESEPDLDKRAGILQEAVARYPGEPHFERSMRLTRDKRDLVNSIVAKARLHEERGQFQEALGQWEILRSVYGQQPGLDFEIERVQKRRDQQMREQGKARWVEEIDETLGAGDYARANHLLAGGLGEFPEDSELTELGKVIRQAQDVREQAQQLLSDGQALCSQGNYDQGLDTLRRAHLMDLRNPVCRGVLIDTLLQRARGLLDNDWRAAEPLVSEALEMDAASGLARSLSTLIEDRKREEYVDQAVSRARQLQAAGDLDGALGVVEQALAAYPHAVRLAQLRGTLHKGLSESRVSQTRGGPAASRSADSTAETVVMGSPPAFQAAAGAAEAETAYMPAPAGSQQVPAAEEKPVLGESPGASTAEPPARAAAPLPPAAPAAAPPAPVLPATPRAAPAAQKRGGRLWMAVAAVVVAGVAMGAFWLVRSRFTGTAEPPAVPAASTPAAPAPQTVEPAAEPPAAAVTPPSEPPSAKPAGTTSTAAPAKPAAPVVASAQPEQIPLHEAQPQERALSVPKPATLAPQAGMADWENANAWSRRGDWLVRQGGEYVGFRITPTNGTFVFQARLEKGKRLQWFLRYADPRNHVLFQMDKKIFYRKVVVNGKTTELAKTAHGLDDRGDLEATIQIDVRPGSIVHNLRKGGEWAPLDAWNDPQGEFDTGKFGFLIPGRDQYGLKHFDFYGR